MARDAIYSVEDKFSVKFVPEVQKVLQLKSRKLLAGIDYTLFVEGPGDYLRVYHKSVFGRKVSAARQMAKIPDHGNELFGHLFL